MHPAAAGELVELVEDTADLFRGETFVVTAPAGAVDRPPRRIESSNVIRMPGYSSLDLGLAKAFTMPWGEEHRLQVRAEAFNLLNYQSFGSTANQQIEIDPQANTPPADWWNFTSIQGTPRVIQFGLRYSF